MKIQWLVTNVTAIGSPDRTERAIFRVILAECFFSQLRPYLLWGKPLCDVRTRILSPNNSPHGHLMKIEWLLTDVTAVGSPVTAEDAILVVI